MRQPLLLLSLATLLFFLGCVQMNLPDQGTNVTISQLNLNPDRYVNQTVTVNGWLSESMCTLMACIPENACCNQCGATLREFNGENAPSIRLSGFDCSFDSLIKIKGIESRVSVTGVWVKNQENDYHLQLVKPNTNSKVELVSFDQPFIIRENVWYQFSSQPTLQFEVTGFEDSRCPVGAQCVWEGEQTVLVHITKTNTPCPVGSVCDPAPLDVTVRLSDNRSKQVDVSEVGWTFKVESVNAGSRMARIMVNVTDEPILPTIKTEWFSISPKQCSQNPWNEWDIKTGWSQTVRFSSPEAMQQALITAWLADQGIAVKDYATRTTSEIVCMACDCPTGQEVAVLVSYMEPICGPTENCFPTTVRQLLDDGFVQLPPTPCTEDARVCADGSVVTRKGPWCIFPPCPTSIEVDINTTITIVKTNYPGFTREPVTTRMTILTDGTGIISTEFSYPSILELNEKPSDFNGQTISVSGFLSQVGCTKMACQPNNPCCNQCFGTLGYSGLPQTISVIGNSCTLSESNGITSLTGTWAQQEDQNYALDVNQRNEKKFNVTREQLEMLAKTALSNGFFALTQEQVQACIADGPTQGIAITINDQFNEIMQIGAECDQSITKPVRDLMEQVDDWAATAQ